MASTATQTKKANATFSTVLIGLVRDRQEAREDVEQDPEAQREQVQQRQRDQDAFGPHARLLLTGAEAGSEPAPELEEIVDAPDGEDHVDGEEPFVDDPVVGVNLALRVALDLTVLRVMLRRLLAHRPPPPGVPDA